MAMQGRVSRYLRRQHLALVVVFLVLSGGSAYALDGSDTVFSDDIVNGEVRTLDVLDDGVRSIDVRDDTLAAGGLTAPDLAPDSVGASEVYDDSVRTEDVRGGLTAADLGPASVGASELADQGWTGSEIYEAGLDTVPTAVIAGKGRSSSRHNDCNAPEGAGYVTCAYVGQAIGGADPANLLVVATGSFGGWDTARCRFRVPPYVSDGQLVGPFVTGAAQIKNGNFLVTRILPVSPGNMAVQLECVSDYVYQAVYDDLHLSAVGLPYP